MQYSANCSLLTEMCVLGTTSILYMPMALLRHSAIFLTYCANKMRCVPPKSISISNKRYRYGETGKGLVMDGTREKEIRVMIIASYKLSTCFIWMKPHLSRNGGMYSGVLYCVL